MEGRELYRWGFIIYNAGKYMALALQGKAVSHLKRSQVEHAIISAITTPRSLPRAVVLKVWFLVQRHQHSVEPWEKCTFSGPGFSPS